MRTWPYLKGIRPAREPRRAQVLEQVVLVAAVDGSGGARGGRAPPCAVQQLLCLQRAVRAAAADLRCAPSPRPPLLLW